MEKIKKFIIKTFYKMDMVKGHAQNKYNNLVDEIAQGAIKR